MFIFYPSEFYFLDVNLAGLRRKTQAKDKYEEPPKKEVVVPPEMMKYGSEKRSPRSLHRSRSPLRGGRHAGHSSNRRSLSPMSRYEELYRRDDQYTRYIMCIFDSTFIEL